MVFQCLQYHNLKSEHDVYRCKDCIRSKSLTAQTMGVINLKKRFLQTKKKKNEMKMQEFVIFVKKKFKLRMLKIKISSR